MNTPIRSAKFFRLIALMLTASTLAACGGGDDSSASTCNNPLLIIPCVIIDAAIADAGPATGSDSGVTAFAGPVGTDGTVATLADFNAFEPNNSFDNANIVTFPSASDGALIGGSLSGSSDDTDTFIFTPNHTGLHSIYICADSCASAAEDQQLSIMLLDQSQTTLESTVAGSNSNLEVAANLTAGMAYYIQVQDTALAANGREFNLVVVE